MLSGSLVVLEGGARNSNGYMSIKLERRLPFLTFNSSSYLNIFSDITDDKDLPEREQNYHEEVQFHAMTNDCVR